MVGVIRFELTTSPSRTARATNCATPRNKLKPLYSFLARDLIFLTPSTDVNQTDNNQIYNKYVNWKGDVNG